jgi:DNA polymerase-3 subunit delta
LKELPESTLAIFVSPNPDKRSRFYKWLNTNAKKEEFIAPKGREMLSWVQRKFQRHQKSISPLAAEMLVFYCGEDLNVISHEVEKLSLLEKTSYDEKTIERYVTPNPEAKIFKVLDMVGKTSPDRLLKEFNQMVQSGEDLMMIFYMIVRQFRLLVQIKYLMDRKYPKDAIQKKMKLAPFQIGALLQQADAFTFRTLQLAYSRLAEMEFGIKTGKTPTSADQSHLFHLRLDQFLCTLYE